MKPAALIAIIAAAGALSASAVACPAYPQPSTSGASQQPVRGLLHSSDTSVCTPRTYWFPAQCTSGRSVTSASETTHHSSPHARKTGSETCTPRTYWFAAHCS
jgi:hypothetical protein